MKFLTLVLATIATVSFSSSALAKNDFPENIAELYSAEANYLDATQRPMLSTTRLQEALEAGFMADDKQQDVAKARSADSQLRWGMHYLPAAIYQQLVDRPKPHKVNDQKWLDLAILQYRRGYWGLTGTVEYSLSRIRKRTQRFIRGQRTMLRSQLYLKQNRFAEADRTLSRYRGSFEGEPYAEYNRAISLLKQNNSEEGAALLDKVGNMRTKDDTLLALRDLANYTLGNWFLNNDQAGTAIPILKKVRVEGPYSNKALLSLGWAYLSSTGKLQRVDEIYSPRCLHKSLAKTGAIVSGRESKDCIPGKTLRIENLGKKEQVRLQRAMTAWQIVQERNPLYPGVQETLMALPYSLDQLGYTRVAETEYKNAIKALQYEASRINDALDVIHSGQLMDATVPAYEPRTRDALWDLETLNLSDKLDMRLLYQLYSQHEFYEAVTNYSQLRQLQSHLKERITELKAAAKPNAPRTITRAASLKLNDTTAAPANNTSNQADAGKTRNQLLGGLSNRGLSLSLTKPAETTSNRQSKLSVWLTHRKTSANSLSKRSTELLPKLETLYKQVGNLAAKHAGYISLQSEIELKVQLDRVNTYMAQARLSLARIQDRLADMRIEGTEAEAPRKIEEINFNPLLQVTPEE